MSKTIKLIELLNRIANKEEVPEKIKYDGDIFKYNKCRKDYILEIDDWTSQTLIYRISHDFSISEILETNIEIIEDEIDIQSIEELDEEVFKESDKLCVVWNEKEREIIKQQNKIIRAIKQINNK